MFEKVTECFTILHQHRLYCWLVLSVATLNCIFIGGSYRSFHVFLTAVMDETVKKVSVRSETAMNVLRNHTNNVNSSYREEAVQLTPRAHHESPLVQGSGLGLLHWVGVFHTLCLFLPMPFVVNALIRFHRPYRLAMLASAFLALISCYASSLVNRPVVLLLTFSLLHGLAGTCVLSVCVLVVGEYFPGVHAFHVLATSLISGGAYGGLIFGPIYHALVEAHHWRGALRVMGFLFFVDILLGALLFFAKPCLRGNVNVNLLLSKSGENIFQAAEEATEQQDSNQKGVEYEPVELPEDPSQCDTSRPRPRWFTVIPLTYLLRSPATLFWGMERALHHVIFYGLMWNVAPWETLGLRRGFGADAFLFSFGECVTYTLGWVGLDYFGTKQLPLFYCIASVLVALVLFINMFVWTSSASLLIFLMGLVLGSGNSCVYAYSEVATAMHGSLVYPASKMVAGIALVPSQLVAALVLFLGGERGLFIVYFLLATARCICLLIIVNMQRLKAKADVANRELFAEMNKNQPDTDSVADDQEDMLKN